MKAKGMTKLEATREWVKEFNAIDQGIIKKLMDLDPDDWEEVTMPSCGDRVYIYDDGTKGEITGYSEETEFYAIHTDDGEDVELDTDDFEVEYYYRLPMWGTMWSFGDLCDSDWFEYGDGIRKMSECGFRIYHSDEFGYFFGIDGAGYNFTDVHFRPLYDARGLKWHDEEAENGQSS